MSHELVSFGLPGNVSRVGWTLPDHLSEQDWVSLGKLLARVEGAIYWIIGDWWAYGGSHYGDRKALVTSGDWEGPEFQTCADAAWVSRRIETSRRREVLGGGGGGEGGRGGRGGERGGERRGGGEGGGGGGRGGGI